MTILIPADALAEIAPLVHAAGLDTSVALLPYTEDNPSPAGLADASGVFRWIAGKRYESLVADGPRVRWLHTASAGLDHVITDAIRQKENLTVTDSGDVFAISIGEFVAAWMLALTHKLPEMLAQRARRRWEWIVHGELFGQSVGVVGLGPIGRGIAARCRALGMRTIGLRRSSANCADVDETVHGPDGLAYLLTNSDWVVVTAALTPETRGLIGANELARMKPTAHLINVARGPIVEEAALLDALLSGRIAGAVLDVFDEEPLPQQSPFWEMENVQITFHSSAWTDGLLRRQRERFVENLARFVNGEPLLGVADVHRGY